MKLLILTQYYPPEMGAPQARLSELAVRLRDKGHQVTILTAMPNYPTGQVFEGYRRKLRTVEEIDGIRVVRTWIWPSKSSRAIPRVLCCMTFALSSVLLGLWEIGRQDIVLFESPPLFLIPSGLVIGRACGARVIMNVSDIWPDIVVRRGHLTGGPFLAILFWLEKLGYTHSDVVALTNPGAMSQINERFPRVTATVISNGVDTRFFRPDLRCDQIRTGFHVGQGDMLVGYCGLHGLAQGLEVVINAAERLKARPDIKIIMIGDGPTKERLMAMAEERNLTNVKFFPPRPKKEMPPILASLDASLIPLAARLPGTMPSKTYEALAAGVPMVVAKGCEGEFLAVKYNTGRVFEPLDNEELAEQLIYLADHPDERQLIRNNCMELAKRFDRDLIAERTNQLLIALAEGQELPEVVW